MTEELDELDGVRDHYRAIGLTGRLKAALSVFGPEEEVLTPHELSALDQFHTRGILATIELARLAGVAAGTSVLDIGSGIGGPARYLSAVHGCRVTGIDLSEPFVDTARYLTERTRQSELVSFEIGNALALPVDDGSIDVALLQHVAMNISDRAKLYREIRRVLPEQGKFATYDVVTTGGDAIYPVPWARTPATSFLLTAATTRELVEASGFRTVAFQDDTEAAKSWVTQSRATRPPPSPNLSLVMGRDFSELSFNLGRNLMEGRLGILTAIFEAVPIGARG